MTHVAPEGYLGTEGRISSGPAPELIDAGYELEIADAPLLHHGLGLADLAHVIALHRAGVIPDEPARALTAELLLILRTSASDFPYDAQYGDAYNSRERELERRLGNLAGWLHTGRTRREAGRIAFRLAMRARLLDLHEAACQLLTALADQELRHASTLWADTTYLQPAQPSTLGHYFGGFAEEGTRHLHRITDAYAWMDQSPAGAGGVGGSRVPQDRDTLTRLLGFSATAPHTRDAMWAIDGVSDAVIAATQVAITADRLAEDLEIFASPQFGYLTLDASLCRASVLMPQKRNPYALPVIRAAASTMIGRATGLLATARSPSARTDNWLHTYGEAAGSVTLARNAVALCAAVVRTLQVDRDRLATAAAQHFTGAADLAEELVLQCRLDYRSAYKVVAHAVAAAIEREATSFTNEQLSAAADEVLGQPLQVSEHLVHDALDPSAIVATRTTLGGSGPRQVRDHARSISALVITADAWRADRQAATDAAEQSLVEVACALAGQRTPT